MRKILSWLLLLKGSNLALGEFLPFLSHLENVYITRGLKAGIAYQKAIRAGVMNYLSGNPLRPEGVRCTTKGIPVCLGPLGYRLESQNLDFIQILVSLLFASRALVTKPILSTDSITAPLKKGSTVHTAVYGYGF